MGLISSNSLKSVQIALDRRGLEMDDWNPGLIHNLFNLSGALIMNKSELVDAMAADAGISKAAANKALDSFMENVGNALVKGDSVSLVGFGTFTVSHRQARKGRNPQTGAELDIPASKAPVFKAGSKLKEKVNK